MSLRRNRDFRALWIGQTASALGTSISTLAYPLLVLGTTGSPALAGLVGTVLATVTFLVRVPASAVADRVDLRRLMLACDAARFVALASLAAAVFADRVTMAHVVAVAVCEALFGALFAPAEAVAVRRVVAADQVRAAVAVNQSRQQVAGLVGPSVGGALFGLGRALPFLADALSYLVSFLAVRTVRTPLRPESVPGPGQPLWRGVGAGLRWLWAQPFLRFAAVWLSATGLLFTSLGLVSIVLAEDLGAGPAAIGAAFTVTGAGGLVGALLAPRVLRLVPAPLILLGYAWIATAATFALLGARSVWWVGVIGAVAFLPVPAVNALVTAEVAVTAPDHLQGRAVSAAVQLTTLFHPVGPVLVGLVLQAVGVRTTIVAYGVGFAVLAVVVSGWAATRPRGSAA